MYYIENMIDAGLDGGEWTTPDHRIVAINCCIGNGNIKTMDNLQFNVKIINDIPTKVIRTITMDGLIEAGCNL